MNRSTFLIWLLVTATVFEATNPDGLPTLPAAEETAPKKSGGGSDQITQLQIFLDNAKFGPGKIDGRWGEFTGLALNRYRIAHGLPTLPSTESAPSDPGVDTASTTPIFTQYAVTEEDLTSLGDIPEEDYAAQEKLPGMPYERLTELLAERFHADEDYIQELNPGVKWLEANAGLEVKVPNVARPFYVRDVKNPKLSEIPAREVLVDVNTKMLDVLEGGRLVASFPITPGSEATPAPIGEWKVKGTAYMPDFRRDESMLKTGVRSQEAHLIPPGPNNAVGVVWIALSKDGIGLHGTHDPDAIGRNASHGCVRLANWDIIELAKLVKPGVKVTIR
jgi:lipoprotein-anchoring transpeptidase ErfK/SrfK